jgi:F-type H+-transporting ATPase subunit b
MAVVNALILAAQETKNPILPETNEIIWGAIAFTVLFFVLKKKGYPQVKRGMEARSERIRNTLAEADKTRDEAQAILDEYRRQLADAKSESSRIIDEARQAADKIRQDLRKQAEDEVAEVKQRAQEDINAQANRAMADLQARVSLMVIELAEKVVEKNLDEEANKALIDRFINEMESAS